MGLAILLATLVLLALPTVVGAQQHEPYPASAQVSRTCGHVKTHRYGGQLVLVTVFRGKASCVEARKIASKFQGPDAGPFHGSDLASGYWIVYGWKCQRGTGGGSGCTHGAHNVIIMQAIPSPKEEEAKAREQSEARTPLQDAAAQATTSITLVCAVDHKGNPHPGGFSVGEIAPHRCLIDRPEAPPSEILDLTDLRWSKWGPYSATATGVENPYGFRAPSSDPYRVRVVVWDVAQNPTTGGPMFKHVTVFSIYAPHGYTVTPY
jgi:hypothetical protein